MTKAEIITEVANGAEVTKKEAERVISAFIEAIKQGVKSGEKIQFVGFGTFEMKERAARQGRNPQTGKTIEIPASKSVGFKVGKAFKDELNA